MAIHQADLHGRKKDRERVDTDAIASYLAGEGSLADGLTLPKETVDGLRRQALALYAAGKWQRTIDVVLGLEALGSIHPADPLMLARCFREVGRLDDARAYAEHAARILNAMGVELPALEGAES